MREFAVAEKKWLDRIRDTKGVTLLQLFRSKLPDTFIEIDGPGKKVILGFAGQTVQDKVVLEQKRDKIESQLIQAINLIKLFEDKGYIFTYNSAAAINLSREPFRFSMGNGSVKQPVVGTFELDSETAELVIRYSARSIFQTPELQKFISDGYITREEGRFNRQYKRTGIALRVTIAALIISIIFNLCNILKGPQEAIQLDGNQFDLLMKEIQAQSLLNRLAVQQFDSLSSANGRSDSIPR